MSTMYETVLEALQLSGIPFAEVAWSKAPSGDYGTFAIDSAYDPVWADGHAIHQTIEGTVHLFSKGNGYQNFQLVQSILNQIESLSWKFNSMQFENDTKLTHWEWVVSWPESL